MNSKGRHLFFLVLICFPGCLYWIGEPIEQMRLKEDPSLIHRSEAHQQVASAMQNVQERCSNFQNSPMRWQLNYFYMAINACRYDTEGEEDIWSGCAATDFLRKADVQTCLAGIIADPCEADRVEGGTAFPAGGRLAAYGLCARAFGSPYSYPVYSIY
mgnify:CR=1 FL=1